MVGVAKITEYGLHPYTEIFDEYSEEDYQELKDAIKGYGGLCQPITIHEGQVLDGRHRYRACKELGIEPWAEELPAGKDPFKAAFESNASRRQLTKAAAALAAARASAHLNHGGDRKGAAYENQDVNSHLDLEKPLTMKDIERRLKVGNQTIWKARKLLKSGETDILDGIRADNLSIDKATTKLDERLAERARAEAAAAAKAAAQAELERLERLAIAYKALGQARRRALAPVCVLLGGGKPEPPPRVPFSGGEGKGDNWYSPMYIVDAARQALGGVIELDPASHEAAQKFIGAEVYYTKADDGLAQDWRAKTLAAGVLYRVDRWRGMEAAGVFAERQDQKLTRWVARDGAEYLSYGFALADYPALVVAYWCDNERLPLESAALDRMIGRQPAAQRGTGELQPRMV